MLRKRGYFHFGLLTAATIHLILYVSLLFRSIELNAQDTNAIGFIIFQIFVPTLLAIIGVFKNRVVWIYLAFFCSLPSLYFFIAGNGYAKWFVASPLLFLFCAIMLQIRQKNRSE